MRKIIANLIWKLAGISPKWGNRIMDISTKLYDWAMWNHTTNRNDENR